MTRQANVWAGTALALLMASAQAMASPAIVLRSPGTPSVTLVQDQPSEEELRRRQQEQQGEQQGEEAAPEEEAPAEQAPEPERAPEPEPEPQPEVAPEPEPQPEQPPAEEPQPEAPSEEAAPEQPQQEAPAEQQPQQEAPAEQPPAEEEPQQQAPAEQAPAEQPPAEQPQQEAPAEQAPAPETPPAEAAPEQPAAPAPDAAPTEQPAEQAPAGEQEAPGEQAPADQAPEAAPAPAEPAPATPETAPSQPEAAPGEQAPAPETTPDQQGQTGQAPQEGAAPVLDSQKEAQPAQPGDQPATGEQPAQPEGQAQPQPTQPGEQQPAQPTDQQAQPAPAEPAGPPPTDDRAAQGDLRIEVAPVTAEQGTRLERAPDFRQRERRQGIEVVREMDDRVLLDIDNRVFVESSDRPRLTRGARDVFYEELPRGRTREVLVRENGVQVITIRNRFGDIIRRSRIAPDGTEYVLAYVDDDRFEEEEVWRDPGLDLPPMQLGVPVEEYILDAERVDDPDAFYEFLGQPPVERVERIYSIQEVKRSARVRDKTRRIDLDTITFEFGSASIPESEIQRLEGVARAMERLLERNPAETFLIEGHTDAVGSEDANLVLSDRRAEAVAEALTNVFGIAPENLTTQGYGERYLKVESQEPERQNRRVAIRRITPLVAPVASANAQ